MVPGQKLLLGDAAFTVDKGLSLRESALELGFVTSEEFDAWVVPADMTHPSAADE